MPSSLILLFPSTPPPLPPFILSSPSPIRRQARRTTSKSRIRRRREVSAMKSCRQIDGVSAARRSSNNGHHRTGAFTRSFLHCTRSGRARPDPAKNMQLPPFRRSRVKIPKEEGPRGDASDPAVVGGSIKDLRARRVFSPNASAIQRFKMGDAATKVEVDASEEQIGGVAAKEVAVSGESLHAPMDGMEADSSGGGEGSPIPVDAMEEDKAGVVVGAADGVGGGFGGVNVSNGSDLESTPPGPECFLDQPTGEGSANRTIKIKGASPVRPFRNRPGLVACSRMRLFSTPNSHCYRRLLPYIMDLTKDNSGTLEIIPVKPQGRKLKSGPMERIIPLPPTQPPPESTDVSAKPSGAEGPYTDPANSKYASNNQQEAVVNMETSQLNKQHEAVVNVETSQLGNSTSALPMPLETAMVDASQSGQSKCAPYNQPETEIMDTLPSECPTECLTAMKCEDSQFLIDAEYKSDIQKTYNLPHPYDSNQHNFISTSYDHQLLQKSTSPPPKRKELSVEELVGTSDSKALLPVQKNEECWPRSAAKSDVQVSFSSGTCKPGQLLPITSNSPTIKGILKRPVIGCKGPCTCLDCASFRLNAERAFEFSRRQFLEADNIAETLMKELSCMRKMVTNSMTHSLVASDKLTQVQVQDICRKASETEAAVRNRLREMESDLTIHCRISRFLRQKVTFAGLIEDNDMPKS